MAYPAAPEGAGGAAAGGGVPSRKEKRKALKKQKRKQVRKESAIKEREEEEELENDPEEQLRVMLREKEDAEAVEMARREFEERERLWLEAAATRRKAQEEAEEEEARRTKLLEEAHHDKEDENNESGNDGEWEYIEEGPAEIIWLDNEIIVKKKRVKVHKRSAGQEPGKEDDDRPTSNPLPPQSEAFTAYQSAPPLSAQDLLGSVAQQTPHFGTEQDKAHCPFHLKTGACRFGSRCSRVHFYPDKSCTLLVKNMYSGPGIAWDQDEGLEVRKILPTDVKSISRFIQMEIDPSW